MRSERSPSHTRAPAPVAAVVPRVEARGRTRCARARPRPWRSRRLASNRFAHAEEVGDEARARPLVELLGSADLLDAALVHHRDPVGHHQRLVLVVGHEHERDPHALLQVLELDLHLLAQLGVERRHRLVEQQQLGLEHERARERHPLLLPARDLVDAARSPGPSSRTSSSVASTRRAISGRGVPRTSRPKATLPSTVRCGKSAYCWKTVLTGRLCAGSAVTSRPEMRDLRPRPAARSPPPGAAASSCRSPTARAASGTRPGSTSSETSRTATVSP